MQANEKDGVPTYTIVPMAESRSVLEKRRMQRQRMTGG